MTTFDGREKAFEEEFAHDQELAFRIVARRNRLLGLWAAEKLGIVKDQHDKYAERVLFSDFEKPGDEDVLERVLKDFQQQGITISATEIRRQMDHFLSVAKKQIMEAAPDSDD